VRPVFIDSLALQEKVRSSSGFVYKVKLLVYRTYFVAVCDTIQAHVNLDRFSLQLNIGDLLIRLIKSRRIRWAGYMEDMRDKRNIYVVLVRKPEGKRPHGRPRQRSQGLEETRWDYVE